MGVLKKFVMGVQAIIVSVFAGCFFSSAWFILIDGIIHSHDFGQVPFIWFYALPAIFVTITNVLMNLVNSSQLSARSNVFDDGGSKKATAWFIVMLALSFCCIGGAIWIEIAHYAPYNASQWPGIALLLNTVLITCSGLLFFFGRGKKQYSGLN